MVLKESRRSPKTRSNGERGGKNSSVDLDRSSIKMNGVESRGDYMSLTTQEKVISSGFMLAFKYDDI